MSGPSIQEEMSFASKLRIWELSKSKPKSSKIVPLKIYKGKIEKD
jgi:hypothetical protein